MAYNWSAYRPRRRPPRSSPLIRRSFSTNVVFTLVASIAPALAAVAALPALYALLGADRLGVMNLAWVAIGAFALLDVGLGRALTHETSRLLALGRPDEVRPVVRATLVLLGAIGVAGGAALALGAGVIVAWLQTPGALAPEIQANAGRVRPRRSADDGVCGIGVCSRLMADST